MFLGVVRLESKPGLMARERQTNRASLRTFGESQEEHFTAAHKALVNISENTSARPAAMRRIEDEAGRSD
jgi:hypothetical protein